jgi:hypothetical protein
MVQLGGNFLLYSEFYETIKLDTFRKTCLKETYDEGVLIQILFKMVSNNMTPYGHSFSNLLQNIPFVQRRE